MKYHDKFMSMCEEWGDRLGGIRQKINTDSHADG